MTSSSAWSGAVDHGEAVEDRNCFLDIEKSWLRLAINKKVGEPARDRFEQMIVELHHPRSFVPQILTLSLAGVSGPFQG
jgi:hypothetical protein